MDGHSPWTGAYGTIDCVNLRHPAACLVADLPWVCACGVARRGASGYTTLTAYVVPLMPIERHMAAVAELHRLCRLRLPADERPRLFALLPPGTRLEMRGRADAA